MFFQVFEVSIPKILKQGSKWNAVKKFNETIYDILQKIMEGLYVKVLHELSTIEV